MYVGKTAALVPDRFEPDTYVLSIDGAEQSHVNPADPLAIRYEYLQRIDAGIQAAFTPDQPIRVLHLGAGALTLVRALQVRYPGSEHVVVDLEPELVEQMCAALPLPDPSRCVSFAMDAALAVRGLRESGLPGAPDTFDVIVVDIFHGAETAPQLHEAVFYQDLAAILNATGLLVINVGDEADQSFARRLTDTAARSFATAAVSGHPEVIGASSSGNTIIVASHDREFSADYLGRWQQLSPQPAAVVAPGELATYVSGRSAK